VSNRPSSPPVFKFFSSQQIFSSHTFNYFQPCNNKTAFCERLLYQCQVNFFGNDLLNNRNIKIFFLSFFACWNSCRSGAAKINHIVLCDEKQQLTTQVYVQRTKGKFSFNHPAGAPERAISLFTLITRALYWSSTYINMVTVMLYLCRPRKHTVVWRYISSHFNLNTRWGKWLLHCTPRREPQYRLPRRPTGPQNRFGWFGEE
jgi:hypothetical protein